MADIPPHSNDTLLLLDSQTRASWSSEGQSAYTMLSVGGDRPALRQGRGQQAAP